MFNELRFPYSDLFPSSPNSLKSLDSYFSLSPNLSPPSASPAPQPSQLSPSHSSPAPSVPPGFSPILVNPPSVSHSVSQESST